MTQNILSDITRAIVNFFFASNSATENQIILICCWILIFLYSLYLLFTIFYDETLRAIKFIQDLTSFQSSWDNSKPNWGKAMVAINKRSQNILIKIFDEDGNFVDSQISARGNFGFNVEPGKYYLEIESAKFALNCIKINDKIVKSVAKLIINDSTKTKIDIYLDNLNVNYDFQPKSIVAFDNLIKSISASIIFITVCALAVIFLVLLRSQPVAGYQIVVIALIIIGLYLDIRKKFTLNLVFNDRDKPVEGALVKIKDNSGKITYLSTDKFGRSRWRFAKGKYRIEANKIGFSKVLTEYIPLNKLTSKKRILLEFKKDLSQ